MKQTKWTELLPYGIVGGIVPEASTMLFKTKEGSGRLSIWLSELQTRIAVDQSLSKEQPYSFAYKILKSLKLSPQSCYFVESKGDRVRAVVRFAGNKMMKFYADEIISFCIFNNCRFFCSKKILNRSSEEELPERFKKQSLEKRPLYLN